MKLTLDTNVLVSAAFWYGNSFKILEKIEGKEIELIISKEIIEELSAVLDSDEIKEKIKNKNLEISRAIEKIVLISTIVEPKQKLDIVKEDIDDNKILECALEGKSDFIISQDNHLLKLREFRGIKIITPGEFMEFSPGNSAGKET